MMNCTSCTKKFPAEQLVSRQSKIMPIHIYLCPTCAVMGTEPRYLIVMAARKSGARTVEQYLLQRRYHGAEILLKEIL